MKLSVIALATSTVIAAVVASQGCAPPGSSTLTREDRICIPGDYVFCRCADQSPGTKLCRSDAKSFESCQSNASGECIGGEIDDPRTNEPIPKDEDPDPNNDPDPPSGVLDTCPGKSTAVPASGEIKLEGNTTAATNDRKGKAGACAVGTGGKDHVYHLIPSGTGSLEVKVQGSDGLDPVAYLRSTCDDEAAQVSCGPVSPSKVAQFKVNVVNGKDYFLFVDGASGSAGKYVATVKLSTGAFCGDGKVDTGETCDDGNKTEDDGCSNNCKQFNGNPTSGGSCPGQPVDVWPGQTATGAGSTSSYGNAWNAPASSACSVDVDGTNAYQDHVYSVTPHESGQLVIALSAPLVGSLANHMIVARRTCATNETDKTYCRNDASIGGAETLTIPVTKDQTVFVAIDGGGVSTNKGDYSLSFKLQ